MFDFIGLILVIVSVFCGIRVPVDFVALLLQVAPSEYMVRPPQPPVYMFLIDVSTPAVVSGMVHVAAETIKTCLDLLPGGERTMVRRLERG